MASSAVIMLVQFLLATCFLAVGATSEVHILSGTTEIIPCGAGNPNASDTGLLSVVWYKLEDKKEDKKEQEFFAVARSIKGSHHFLKREFSIVDGSSLRIKNVVPKHRGSYKCVIETEGFVTPSERTLQFIVEESGSWLRHVTIGMSGMILAVHGIVGAVKVIDRGVRCIKHRQGVCTKEQLG